MHVAVTGVHVQRHEHAAAQHALMDGIAPFAHLVKMQAAEDIGKRRLNL